LFDVVCTGFSRMKSLCFLSFSCFNAFIESVRINLCITHRTPMAFSTKLTLQFCDYEATDPISNLACIFAVTIMLNYPVLLHHYCTYIHIWLALSNTTTLLRYKCRYWYYVCVHVCANTYVILAWSCKIESVTQFSRNFNKL